MKAEGVGFIFILTEDTPLEYPGLMKESFPVYVSTDVLTPGCHIVNPRCRDKVLVIQDKPMPWGVGFKHMVRIVTDDVNEFFPPELLKAKDDFEYTGWHMPHVEPYNYWIYNYIKI